MSYSIILTTAGKTKVAEAIANNTTIKLAEIAFGDGNGNEITPDQNAITLIKEVYRTNIIFLTKHPSDTSVVIAECIIPLEAGGFWIREIGIYDDTNTLIAIGNYPSFYKEDENSGAASELKVNVMLKVNNANTELIIDSSLIFTTKAYVDAELSKKQNSLIAGDNISIIENTISARYAKYASDITYDGEVADAENVEEALDILATTKQNKIPVFETQEEYETAVSDLDEETILLKLY
jgi:phage-related tail fiber protein